MGIFEGKVVVVIGGGRGLGRAVARRFAQAGADLVLAARTESELNEATTEIKERGARVVVVPAHATQEEDIARIRQEARRAFSEVDIVINCAGEALVKSLEEITVADWDRIVNANLKSVFLVMREFLPAMMERRSGQLINVTSRAGIFGSARASVYGAAKAGAIFFSRVWAKEASQYGVKVLSIAPGPMDTPMRWAATPDFARGRTISADVMADFIVWVTSYPDVTFEETVIPVSLHY